MSTGDLQAIGSYGMDALKALPLLLVLLFITLWGVSAARDFILRRGGLKILIEDYPWACLLAGVVLLGALAYAVAATLAPPSDYHPEWGGPPPINWITMFLGSLIIVVFMGFMAFYLIGAVGLLGLGIHMIVSWIFDVISTPRGRKER